MMRLREIEVGGRRAKVWEGGAGDPLVLVHGGWGGAEMHWSAVWNRLAERFRVLAPELPGVGDHASAGLPSFDAHAQWIAALLSALEVPPAWCAGNSFGAAVVWQLAARLGARCRGVILVNGPPPPEVPSLVRAIAAIPPVRRLFRTLYLRTVFNPAVLRRAYADPARAPAELCRGLADPRPAHVDLMLGIVLTGARPAPAPVGPTLLAWGEADRLPGTGPDAARKLQRRIPGAKLVLFPAAGHCPQVERPQEFVHAIEAFVGAAAPRQEDATRKHRVSPAASTRGDGGIPT